MRLRLWHAAVPVVIAAAVAANLPEGCDAPGSALALASCARTVDYAGVHYEALALDRPVAARLLRPARRAVEPDCVDVGSVDGCGVRMDEPRDRATTVRPVRGFAPEDLLGATGTPGEPHVVLVPVDEETGWRLTPAARRFVNRHLDQPLAKGYGVLPPDQRG